MVHYMAVTSSPSPAAPNPKSKHAIRILDSIVGRVWELGIFGICKCALQGSWMLDFAFCQLTFCIFLHNFGFQIFDVGFWSGFGIRIYCLDFVSMSR